MEKIFSAVIEQMVRAHFLQLCHIMKYHDYDFDTLNDSLGGFNFQEDSETKMFDFNFQSLNGTIICRKGLENKCGLDGYFDIWVDVCNIPIASVVITTNNGDINYKELYNVMENKVKA